MFVFDIINLLVKVSDNLIYRPAYFRFCGQREEKNDKRENLRLAWTLLKQRAYAAPRALGRQQQQQQRLARSRSPTGHYCPRAPNRNRVVPSIFDSPLRAAPAPLQRAASSPRFRPGPGGGTLAETPKPGPRPPPSATGQQRLLLLVYSSLTHIKYSPKYPSDLIRLASAASREVSKASFGL